VSRLRRPVLALTAAASCLATGCAASSAATPPPGLSRDEFKVFVVPDMEGMAGTVFSREVLSGAEANCDDCFTSPDYEGFRRCSPTT
jgi:hypothetical protein